MKIMGNNDTLSLRVDSEDLSSLNNILNDLL